MLATLKSLLLSFGHQSINQSIQFFSLTPNYADYQKDLRLRSKLLIAMYLLYLLSFMTNTEQF